MVEAYRPLTLREALEIRSLKNTMLFAGGSDIMVKYRAWSGTVADLPKAVLFIGHLHELQEISVNNKIIKIGAAATFSQILQDKRIPEYIKLPIAQIGSPAIRNQGTIGGNICNSSPAGDTLPMLYVLDAEVTVESLKKAYTIGISDFISGPGRNMLKPEDILTHISIPLGDYNQFYYKKVGPRKANSISKVSFFALDNTDASQIQEIKMAFGAVAPIVIRSPEKEVLLKSIKKTDIPKIIDEVKGHYNKLINPIDDLRSTKEYRRNISMQILENFLLKELI